MERSELEYRDAMDNLRFTDKEKERMMKNLMNQENQNGKTRRVSLRVALVAAALAAGCALSIAAGVPAQVYHFISGGSVTVNPGTNTAHYDRLYDEDPVEVDGDGRVWFTADGRRLDITDRVDENTPYIYERADEATGQKGYLVVGGSHDNLGWMEWYQMDGDWFWHAENCLNSDAPVDGEYPLIIAVPNGVAPAVGDGPVPSAPGDAEPEPYQIDFRPWVEVANAELAGLGVVAYGPQVD